MHYCHSDFLCFRLYTLNIINYGVLLYGDDLFEIYFIGF